MASHAFNFAKAEILRADIDLETGDVRLLPLMTNTTAVSQNDGVTACSGITTLDVFDGANSPTTGMALDNQTVNVDDANDRAEFDCDDEQVLALGAGTRDIAGLLSILFGTTVADSVPIYWHEYATPKTPDGGTFNFTKIGRAHV